MGEFFAEGCGKGVEGVKQDTRASELLQEEDAEGGKEEVGGPNSESWGELAGFGECDPDIGEKVVSEDEEESEDNACAFAASPGGKPQGDTDEHEDKACEGIGESEVEFDLRGAYSGWVE